MKIFQITLLLILAAFSNIHTQNFWENTPSLETEWIWSLAINSSGDIFAGTNHGVFRSTNDGGIWSNISPPSMLDQPIRSILINSDGDIYVPTLFAAGVFHSTDNGFSWNNIGSAHFDKCVAKTNSNQWLYCGTDAVGIVRTKNNGVDLWPSANNGMTATSTNILFVDSNEYIFVGTNVNSSIEGSGGVYRSTDWGDSWVQVNTGLSNLKVFTLIKSNGFIFAGTEGGGVFRSTNNGDSWVQINIGLSNLNVYSLALNSAGEIFAGIDGGVFRSTDNGDSWVQNSTGLSNIYVKAIAIAPNGFGFAGTEGGIFKSLIALPVELTSFSAAIKNNKLTLNWETATEVDNYGFEIERAINSVNNTEWAKIGFVKGYGNSNSPKEYSFVDSNPFGGSKFQYRLKQIDTDGQFEYSNIVEVEVVPDKFELSQNYPNPFNPSTTIRFSLPEASQIKINIYNMIGEQVATIADGMYESGYHKVTFNASNLPSGAYIYRIESSDFVQVKKMILMK